MIKIPKAAITTLISITLTLVAFPAAAEKPSILYKKTRLRGAPEVINVNLNTTKKLVLWGVSTGDMSSYLDLYSRHPERVKISAAATFVKDDHENALKKTGNHYNIELKNLKKLLKDHSECLPISVEESDAGETPEDYPPVSDPICDEIGREGMELLSETLSETFGGKWSIGNACAYFLANVGDTSPPNVAELCREFDHGDLLHLGIICPPTGGLFARLVPEETSQSAYYAAETLYGLVRKDACATVQKSEYLIMISYDFSKLDPALYPTGVQISVRAKENKLKKGKQAAIKPVSEGRYSPRPLVMMNWLGDTCGNKIEVVSWKKNKPTKVTPLSVYALLSYKGMVLNLALVDKVLTGGKATFNLFTRHEAYGVCFNLQRTRQNKNGYPR